MVPKQVAATMYQKLRCVAPPDRGDEETQKVMAVVEVDVINLNALPTV